MDMCGILPQTFLCIVSDAVEATQVSYLMKQSTDECYKRQRSPKPPFSYKSVVVNRGFCNRRSVLWQYSGFAVRSHISSTNNSELIHFCYWFQPSRVLQVCCHQKACFNIWCVSAAVFPSLKQKFLDTLLSQVNHRKTANSRKQLWKYFHQQ
jgi:hypothetical protein